MEEECYTQEDIEATFRSLLSEAKTHIANRCYSKAIEWHERAFEFGLLFQDQIAMLKILDIAFHICELAIELPRCDRNYCRPIYISRKVLRHLSKDKEGLEHGIILAWAVLEELKPIAESLCIDDQQALQILELEKNRYVCSFNKNNYLRN